MVLCTAETRTLLEVGDAPYFLAGDFNINPSESGVIKILVAKGLLIDVSTAFGHGSQHTFARDGTLEGVEGKG